MVRSRVGSGYGPLHIRAELATHGLDREAIDAAMASFEGDWNALARELVRRRFGFGGELEPAQRRKAADWLARRGHDGDAIRAALSGAGIDGDEDWGTANRPGKCAIRPRPSHGGVVRKPCTGRGACPAAGLNAARLLI